MWKITCGPIEAVLLRGEAREIYNISAGEEKTNLEVVKKSLRRY
ncbi:hypothetical protein [Pyrococcus kukulkanii]